jgi:hypothetical protein
MGTANIPIGARRVHPPPDAFNYAGIREVLLKSLVVGEKQARSAKAGQGKDVRVV